MDQFCKGSDLVYNSCLDLTQIPPTDIGILSSEDYPIYPSYSVKSNDNPIEFVLSSSSFHYIDLKNSFLYIRAKIVNDSADPKNEITVCEAFFASLFSSCELEINNVPITTNSNLYSYKYFLETLLNYSEGAKSSYLLSEFWDLDEVKDQKKTTNALFDKRLLATTDKSFEIIGRISPSVTNQSKFLPPNTSVKVTLRRSLPQFSLCGDVENLNFKARIEFEEVIYYVKKHAIHPKIIQNHQQLLKTKRFSYPYFHNEVNTFQIATGSLTIVSDALFAGTLPNFLVFGLVPAKQFAGDPKSSPFWFSSHKLKNATLTCDGDNISFKQIELDENNNNYLRAYTSLISVLPYNNDLSYGLNKRNYTKGRFLIALDLSATHETDRFRPVKHGMLKLELKFKENTTESLICICLGQFERIFQIGKDNTVYTDPSQM
ncbi:hypothetical protein Fcan01_24323 [Folsomia candida]|uniref:Uncharacterized protein n=1 Tax=Folsomia candida TaxID=158441 RepID=A0A226D9F0_FOLCA|nr:hypothetical protein Fcan01_24323 [Folsomia candida]